MLEFGMIFLCLATLAQPITVFTLEFGMDFLCLETATRFGISIWLLLR